VNLIENISAEIITEIEKIPNFMCVRSSIPIQQVWWNVIYKGKYHWHVDFSWGDDMLYVFAKLTKYNCTHSDCKFFEISDPKMFENTSKFIIDYIRTNSQGEPWH
jgi:hypothetical protein